MSLLTVAEARDAGLGRGLTDAQLQARINGTEAQLAHKIGPLSGVRTTTFPAGRRVWLNRPAKAGAVVSADGTPLTITDDYELWPSGQVYFVGGDQVTTAVITVLWEPDDEAAIKEAVIALLDLALRPYQSESIGDYSYARGGQKMLQRTRDEIVAGLVYGRGTGL